VRTARDRTEDHVDVLARVTEGRLPPGQLLGRRVDRRSVRPAAQPIGEPAAVRLHAGEPPLAFATRVIANWKSQASEGLLNTLESFTWRGLAVAAVILIGSVAFGYDALSGFLTGDTSLPDEVFQYIPGLDQ